MNPEFLNLAEVLEIHRDQIDRYGGSPGIRDMGLLLSALAVPAASFGGSFLHADLFEMAAAHLFHIVRNHPFIDGNERAGALAALIFLSLNGIEIDAEEDSFENMVFEVAAGHADKRFVREFLQGHVHRQ